VAFKRDEKGRLPPRAAHPMTRVKRENGGRGGARPPMQPNVSL